MNNPKVSVFVITFNQVNFIKKALDSILNQKVSFEYEIIIGDDCSTDGTREILMLYKEKYKSIKLILHPENIGSLNNQNSVLKACKGEFIAMCEGDDYWTNTEKLQLQVDLLCSKPEYSACFHQTNQIFEGEVKRDTSRIFGKYSNQTTFLTEDTIVSLSPWHTSSFMFRSSALKIPAWFNELRSSYDMALFSVISASGPIYGIPKVMSTYRKNIGGITNNKFFKRKLYHITRIELIKFIDEFHDFKYHTKAKEVINFHKKELKKLTLLGRLYRKMGLIVKN